MTSSLMYLGVIGMLSITSVIAALYFLKPSLFPALPSLTLTKRRTIMISIGWVLAFTSGFANFVEPAFQQTEDKRIWLYLGIMIIVSITLGMALRDIWPARPSDAERPET
jgi:hypothetical protein